MRKHHPLTDLSTYIAARWAAMMLGFFPVNANLRTAKAFGSMLWTLDQRHRNLAIEHVSRSLPELSPQHASLVALRSMQHFCQLGIDVMFTTRTINVQRWHQYVHFQENLRQTIRITMENRGAILLTGHYGNWEVLGYTMATLGLRSYSVARPIDNPYIDTWLLGVRQRKGQIILSKRGVTTTAQEVLENKGILGFIADQNAGPKGMFVPFFGRLASTYKSIGLLAIQHRVPVIVGCARRRGDRFEFDIDIADIIEPQDWSHQPDELRYITQRYTLAIEKMVRQDPTQYLWIHRRWKTRPKGETTAEGQPPSPDSASVVTPNSAAADPPR